ncbi:HAD-IC family P-type ATPase [Phytohabitans sp. ZYX-F-186]|uniref:HAD-IC family P-type ATPase n=1 Tax=Phytohabitans maris TaxID=3071409 RepID=A0ABU0ZFS5_9ACTN|nr:HAD-IC family P-type ATPase [Phytohabitans sp. ZYX-F-186]MDQ7905843.1 HAD-IC family P-type ATPase [Phytohabitans sp. ZYX-F-186]
MRPSALLRRAAPFDKVSRFLAEVDRAAVARTQPDEPSTAVTTELLALGVNLAGAGVAAAGVLTRTARLPDSVPALVSAAVNVPQLRTSVRSRLGPAWSEPVVAAGEATLSALAGQPVGLLVDAVHRVQRLSEARARAAAWRRRAGELFTEEAREADEEGEDGEEGTDGADRPRPLAEGPVERYASRAATVGLGGTAGGLLAASPRFSAAALAATTAKPARLAKESFAARLGRCVSEHDVVVVDREALRRLDRVDTVVIDAGVLVTGRWMIDEVRSTGADPEGADDADLHARALGLLDPADPARERRRNGWRVAPKRAGHRGTVTLFRRDRAVAEVTLLPELDPYAEALVSAAAGVGDVYVAGVSSRLDRRLKVTGSIPGGSRLGASLRRLEEEGRGIVLIAGHGRPGLAAADIGIAVVGSGPVTPAHRGTGHLVCGPGLADVVQLLAAVPAARLAAAAGARIAGYEAVAATVLGLAGTGAKGSRNALLASNVAALAGIAVGVWHADPVIRMRPPRPVDRNPWHAIPVREVLARLRSSPRGLDEREAAVRQPDRAGTEPETTGLGHAVAEELANPLTPALAAGAGLAAAVGSTLDAALIGSVVAVNSLVGGVQRLGADRAVRRLAEHASVPVRLLRDGEQVTVPAEEVVPGDVVELRAGDAVPADCRVVEAVGLEMDEANLTGESLPVAKTAQPSAARMPADRVSMVYEGTAVAAGHGLATVVAAGPDTEARRAEHLAQAPRPGAVHDRLDRLTRQTLPLSAAGGALLLAANLLRGQSMSQALSPAISLTVAAVPEGLPSVATVAQLAAARRLSRRGVLVRNPGTLESLGRVQALCFDKTGTLTEGRLRLRLVTDGADEAAPDALPERLRAVLAAALRATPAHRTGRRLPHPTDRAVAGGGQDAGVTVQDGLSGWERQDELPFEPRRGFHAAVGTSREGRTLSVKGAPETVVAQCTARLLGGDTRPLDDRARRELTGAAGRLAERGYRVLAVAESPVPETYALDEEHLDGLRFLGFVALADRVRPAAAEAVAKLRGAGVRVVMVTGDHPRTAEAVATELGVLDGGQVLSGAELDRMDDEELTRILPGVTVFARTAPAQKVRIVRLLRRAGQVVAVTGDGANDAPAIRAAHVGVALGSRATPAARDAADVVVTDDRIETVVDAVVEGRVLWSSVRDALAVLLGGNLGEIGFTVGAGILGGPGLNTRQLLLVNMLTDVVPALALAARPPAGATPEALLAEGPDASLGPALNRDIRLRAVVTAAATAVAWTLARLTGTATRASTVALVAMVGAQLGQTMVAGRLDRVVAVACLASVAVLAVAVQTPGLSQLMGSRPLGPVGWSIALATAAAAAGVAWWLAARPNTPAGDAPADDPDPAGPDDEDPADAAGPDDEDPADAAGPDAAGAEQDVAVEERVSSAA